MGPSTQQVFLSAHEHRCQFQLGANTTRLLGQRLERVALDASRRGRGEAGASGSSILTEGFESLLSAFTDDTVLPGGSEENSISCF